MTNLLESIEEWKDIPGNAGLYQISSTGRVRSSDHYTYRKICKGKIFIRGKVLNQNQTADGYFQVTLGGGGQKQTIAIHRTMYKCFINPTIPKGFEVDHIDNNKANNVLSNLQLLPSRSNSVKRSLCLRKTSKYSGVSWSSERNKWQAHIRINGKSKGLGRFSREEDAAIAYINARSDIA
ncbi:NUMOD4 domain-containing protein [Flavitalea antarctica]